MKRLQTLLSLTLVLSFIVIKPRLLIAQAVKNALTDQINAEIKEGLRQVPLGPPQFAMSGELKIDSNTYLVNGEIFSTNADTQIIGSVKSGTYVQVRGLIVNGRKVAKVLVVNEQVKAGDAPTLTTSRARGELRDAATAR